MKAVFVDSFLCQMEVAWHDSGCQGIPPVPAHLLIKAMGTHDVTLPSEKNAVFPPRCVGCELEHPTTEAEISVTGAHSGPGLGEAVVDAALGAASRGGSNIRVTLKVPACPACVRALERRHFWKTVALYGGALVGVAVGIVVMGLSGSTTLGVIVILSGVFLPVIWDLASPPGFTFTPMGAKMNYEFRSVLCAREFADANGISLESQAPAEAPPIPQQTPPPLP